MEDLNTHQKEILIPKNDSPVIWLFFNHKDKCLINRGQGRHTVALNVYGTGRLFLGAAKAGVLAWRI